MTYQECLTYLYEQLPMFQQVGSSALTKNLDNTIALCQAVGNPQNNFPCVHIAGTNGKGSSSNMLAAVLQSAGYRVGLYTSPHLKEFTERIKVNGADIPADYLIKFVEENIPLFEKIKPSFFEMTVALAFKYFADVQVDIAVVEVGLGGRLDSTNIITPLVSLITNISLDHQNILGNDLAVIAAEKAGIIKKNIPAVISKTQPEIADVFTKKAEAEAAPLHFADQEIAIEPLQIELSRQYFRVKQNNNLLYPNLELGLAGNYQIFNLPGVIKTIQILSEKGFLISEAALKEGLANVNQITGFKGRWQVVSHEPLTICDTGHNEDGIKQIIQQLKSLKRPAVHMVFGVVKDKDVTKILELLPPEYNYYFCQAHLPRALPAPELALMAREIGLTGEAYPDVNLAYEAAKRVAAPADVIFIGGSTFVVAEFEGL
ncbi:bifunctional folylpolyglutamate synthase/dihydrofolate synthase [Adhaeribacter rhizoryzae]|uniref:Dihydrofolate synthase/folylpolyglutamate synthase n=1 Tax=Adhaeribacter rhizoryzae TaxID=2607907 RepID=A0A5M6DMY2_9BACT|nr:folylpolyglutamate synthase/dihydrofolate synthase family protein [Adhaeribacter rhizoryzae]KAA5547736.1 bifunctional folylpolyglutamate synthase/dihydrofolate synthase [Adhaeribacter rhizoryzae]